MANNLGKYLKNMTNIHINMYGMLFAFNRRKLIKELLWLKDLTKN